MFLITTLSVLVFSVVGGLVIKDWWNGRKQKKRGKGISLLVPFRSDGAWREEVWEWLRQYWAHELPAAEIIMGEDNDPDKTFCKTEAVNNAAKKAKGDIFVILDADCYISGDVLIKDAEEIRKARRRGHRLWFIPYRRFYRLTKAYTEDVLESDPAHPLFPPVHPGPDITEEIGEKKGSSSHGHWFGALIQMLPREAFEFVGGMDPRFRDWGGEDVSFMRAVDTLWARHHTSNNPVYHLWHPRHGNAYTERHWAKGKPQNNDWLSNMYTFRIGRPDAMRELVDEGFNT